jgi:O-antigen ligase
MFFVFVATLFLTLSRGAIYAFVVAMIFFTVVWGIKKTWRVMWIWLAVGLAFLFTLNLQGIFAEVSKTDDTYISGVSKVVNQLTLGVVDFGGSQVKKNNTEKIEENAAIETNALSEENVEDEKPESEKAVFDGYVEVSTNNRVDVWSGALKTWVKDPATVLFGVGIGSGLISIYENGAFASSREIINNQYVSLLLEGGILGIVLLVLSLALVYKVVCKNRNRVLIFTLIIAYMISLCFFSGLPNALQIYLFPAIFIFLCGKSSYRKQ